ncbi:MAG: hypothetical protein ACLPX1_12600 [Steroidobacteraceae bacterium]
MKSVAIVLVVLVLGLLAWGLLQSNDITLVVNGHKLVGPARIAVEGWGVLVAIVSLFCAAILLAFVFAGVGLIVLGALVLGGLAAAWFVFPFLLPLLIPLFLVWVFVAAMRGRGKSGR